MGAIHDLVSFKAGRVCEAHMCHDQLFSPAGLTAAQAAPASARLPDRFKWGAGAFVQPVLSAGVGRYLTIKCIDPPLAAPTRGEALAFSLQ